MAKAYFMRGCSCPQCKASRHAGGVEWLGAAGDLPLDDLPQPGDPHPEAGHPAYLALLDEMKELHCRKAADYGRGADPFANVRAGAEFGVPAWVGVMIRANDKVHRIKSFIANGSLKNESVEDSLKDLAAYALIALVLFREEQGKAVTA